MFMSWQRSTIKKVQILILNELTNATSTPFLMKQTVWICISMWNSSTIPMIQVMISWLLLIQSQMIISWINWISGVIWWKMCGINEYFIPIFVFILKQITAFPVTLSGSIGIVLWFSMNFQTFFFTLFTNPTFWTFQCFIIRIFWKTFSQSSINIDRNTFSRIR